MLRQISLNLLRALSWSSEILSSGMCVAMVTQFGPDTIFLRFLIYHLLSAHHISVMR